MDLRTTVLEWKGQVVVFEDQLPKNVVMEMGCGLTFDESKSVLLGEIVQN